MSAGDWKEMFAAAESGDYELLKHHIDNGCNPNYQHPEVLRTPLVVSILEEHFDIAEYLLATGADPNLESYFDNLTPIQAAKKVGNKKLLEKLNKT